MAEVVYEVDDLVKYYRGRAEPATDHVSLDIGRGEIFGILGDNGAGKSTLVRQLVNLLRPTSGVIRLFGEPVDRDPVRVARTVGYMPQSSAALNRLTVAEALYFVAHLRGLTRRDAVRERDAALETWRLGGIRGTSSSRLSGGQRRLLQLAIAMAGRLPVVVLDEPTNDLDPVNRKHVWEVLRAVNAEHGTTIIFITHDAIEAERIVQRVGIMRGGSFTAIGPPAELKRVLRNRMRLEVGFPGGRLPELPADLVYRRTSEDALVATVDAARVPSLLAELGPVDALDFRLYSATLEDLYLHYANGHQETDAH
ncbi:ABC transporter ATP-binding protein [Actinosynnema sp. NPDC023587]|uniref:ABC transporter ATP-binding protein n=1 Tax=Actinosynnema sp. NPDC023587 TaxID=3154695 RepID=UPI0033F756A4